MLEIIGLVAGLLVGLFAPWTIPSQWSLYVAAGLLAALDSALGGFRARIKGEFNLHVFLSGTVGNAAIAAFLTCWGRSWAFPSTWQRWWCSEQECSKTLRNPQAALDLQAKER